MEICFELVYLIFKILLDFLPFIYLYLDWNYCIFLFWFWYCVFIIVMEGWINN